MKQPGMRKPARAWPVVLAMLVIMAITASLGIWQLDRARQKQALAAQRQAALAMPPIELTDSRAADREQIAQRRIQITGKWQPGRTIFLDNRTHKGVAGFHVLSLMALPADRYVVVLRGWVARDIRDRRRIPPVDLPAGAQTVIGLPEFELPQPMQLGTQTEATLEQRIWQYFDLSMYQRWSDRQVLPFVVRQVSDANDGLIRQWIEPGDGVDRHHGYAFQWFAMCVAAGLFSLWLLFGRRNTSDR